METDLQDGVFDFLSIYSFFQRFLPDSLNWLAFSFTGLFLAFLAINLMIAATGINTWFERRVLGRFQSRLGPNRWGPFGLLQPLADVMKLLTKEDTVPESADRPVFNIAPIALVAPTLLIVAVIPFGPHSFLGRLNVGILFIAAITSLNTIAIFMGGFASRNKYAMLGAMRGVAMLVSYEIPMALAITSVVLVGGSLSLLDIVNAQAIPFALVTPLGFLVFVAAASAEMSRTPFDQIEAESELGAGYHTEYSSIKFGVFQLAEFMAPIVTALVITVLFLGGTRGWSPFDFNLGVISIPWDQIWLIGKTFLVVFGLLWMRATWPRLRVDQIMGFAWKGLFALGMFNILLMAVEVEILRDSVTLPTGELTAVLSTGDLWIMAGINWIVTLGAVVVIGNVLGQRRLKRPTPQPSPLANMYAEAD